MSPLVVGGLLIVHAGGHEGGALIAFDPATGAEKWTLEGDGPSYSSPIVTSFAGQQQLVIQVHRKILGVDPASGRALWSFPFVTPCDQNIVTPLRAGDLIVVSSQDTGTQGIRPTRKGTEWVPQVAWHTQEVSMYMSSPVLVNGRVVGLSHRKKGQYFALDPATGTVEWKSEPGQGENAAFVLARGRPAGPPGRRHAAGPSPGRSVVLPDPSLSHRGERHLRASGSHRAGHPDQGRERAVAVSPGLRDSRLPRRRP